MLFCFFFWHFYPLISKMRADLWRKSTAERFLARYSPANDERRDEDRAWQKSNFIFPPLCIYAVHILAISNEYEPNVMMSAAGEELRCIFTLWLQFLLHVFLFCFVAALTLEKSHRSRSAFLNSALCLQGALCLVIWRLLLDLWPSLAALPQPAQRLGVMHSFQCNVAGRNDGGLYLFYFFFYWLSYFLHCACCRQAIVQTILNILPGIFQRFFSSPITSSAPLCSAKHTWCLRPWATACLPAFPPSRLPACLLYDLWDTCIHGCRWGRSPHAWRRHPIRNTHVK